MDDPLELLHGTAEEVAPRLLGCLLIRELDAVAVTCRIVETEAYNQEDAASHSYRGVSARTLVMFGPPGNLYVYFTYGMHYCCNVVVGPPGYGAAVLIRAVEPISGEECMQARRKGTTSQNISNGPAKLCQALQIDKACNGHDLHKVPLRLVIQPALTASHIVQTTRIGITHAKTVPWRFYERGNKFVSRPL